MKIRESAKRARVSTATVSRTINRHPSVQRQLAKAAVRQELSVIGFDNIHLSQYILAPLTTIEMSQTELGRLAFQALLQDARREINPQGTEYILKTTFVLRDSTAVNPGKGRS
jgi:LacI family transcriptional regulator